MVIVFQIDDYYHYLLEMKHDERLFMDKTIYKAIHWMFRTKYSAFAVKADLEKIAILISLPAEADEETFLARLIGTIKYLQKEIKDNCNLTVCAGISGDLHSISNVHSGYFQALKAVSYKAIYGKHTIIHYNDILEKHQQITPFPAVDISELNLYLKEGKIEAFAEKLNCYVEDIITSEYISFDFLNALLSNILFGIVKLALESRCDLSQLIQEDMFMKLYSIEFIQDKKEYVLKIAGTVVEYIQLRKTSHNKTFQTIMAYINQNYDKTISLTMMSDSLGINSSYISTLIKSELGYGFVDYLNQLRINKALQLLEDRKLAIKAISEACGYDTVHSFIRNFKKLHFYTPSEYRSRTNLK